MLPQNKRLQVHYLQKHKHKNLQQKAKTKFNIRFKKIYATIKWDMYLKCKDGLK